MQDKYILGISGLYHDSAASLIKGGEIISAAQEERFSRIKHDHSFPNQSINFCLKYAKIKITDIDTIVFYDKPFIKFERLIESYLSYAPIGILSFLKAMPTWLKEKLFLKKIIRREIAKNFKMTEKEMPQIFFGEHHQSHAASAFYPSPFQNAAILCLDGVGEWATTTAWHGEGNNITPLWEINFPHSIGLLYSAFTYYLGFKVNSGEYKVMGLAPYGEPIYYDKIIKNVVDIRNDGSFKLNMKYFNFVAGLTMTNSKFENIFSYPRRDPEAKIEKIHMDIAASIQKVTEEIVLRIVKNLREETNCKNLCLAGGVALNCVINGIIKEESIFDDIWIQPAAGDAGGSLGCALAVHYHHYKNTRDVTNSDKQKGSLLGPSFSNIEVKEFLKSIDASYEELNESDIFFRTAKYLTQKKIIGWFNGRMEFGPRALGARSILADPRSSDMQSKMNLKIKYRESFRPFAPSVLAEDVEQYFEYKGQSPYMLMVAKINKNLRKELSQNDRDLTGLDKLKITRSTIPAVTHVDYSARVQTVHNDTNPRYYQLISAFKKETGCSVLINTSFNVRGEPIVCTPQDAYRCFMRTDMDVLVLENHILLKENQKPLDNDVDWKKEFELD